MGEPGDLPVDHLDDQQDVFAELGGPELRATGHGIRLRAQRSAGACVPGRAGYTGAMGGYAAHHGGRRPGRPRESEDRRLDVKAWGLLAVIIASTVTADLLQSHE